MSYNDNTEAGEQYSTQRPTVATMENLLYKSWKVLDHGFIRLIDYMGDDNAIVQAARVSYGKGTKQINQDRGLIRYLLRHHHTTPFEMCELKLHLKMPIFVARQWIRHRTANINEYSGRYSIMSKEFYLPKIEVISSQSAVNKQCRASESLDIMEATHILNLLKHDAEMNYAHYQEMLNLDEEGHILDPTKQGVAREIARMNLNLNYYTELYWKIDLHNLLHFLKLRGDKNAQYEIRAYAELIADIVKAWAPITYEAFEEYVMNAVHLSATAAKIIQSMLHGQKVSFEDYNISKREWEELMNIFQLSEEKAIG